MTRLDLAALRSTRRRAPRRALRGGEHPGTRSFVPAFDEAQRRSAADFVRARGETLRPIYVALCLACWLRRHAARDAVSGADIRALFPTADDGRPRHLRSPTDVLRRARDAGLMASLGDGWYAVTPTGDAVVEALPDLEAVVAMLGPAGAKCAARPRGWAADHWGGGARSG